MAHKEMRKSRVLLAAAGLFLGLTCLWVRVAVLQTAMHGHYADCHLTLPRLECIGAAAVMRGVGRPPEQVASWSRDLPAGRPIVVTCVHGHEVSQNVAKALNQVGDKCAPVLD